MGVSELALQSGDRIAVVGRSGSGKSTFLKMLAGLVRFEGQPISVTIENGKTELLSFSDRVDSRRLRTCGVQIAYVPQQLGLWSTMSVRDNITLPIRRLRGYSEKQAMEMCRGILVELGLIDKIEERPFRLSGGEQQRIAIARAALCEPELVLLDEITSALDPSTTGEVLGLLSRVFPERSTVIFVTHQFGFARRYASQILMFERQTSLGASSISAIDDGTAPEALLRLVSDSQKFYSW